MPRRFTKNAQNLDEFWLDEDFNRLAIQMKGSNQINPVRGPKSQLQSVNGRPENVSFQIRTQFGYCNAARTNFVRLINLFFPISRTVFYARAAALSPAVSSTSVLSANKSWFRRARCMQTKSCWTQTGWCRSEDQDGARGTTENCVAMCLWWAAGWIVCLLYIYCMQLCSNWTLWSRWFF